MIGHPSRYYEVTYSRGRDTWLVSEIDGNEQYGIKIFDTKKEAVSYARRLAKKYYSSLVVKNKDGSLSEKVEY